MRWNNNRRIRYLLTVNVPSQYRNFIHSSGIQIKSDDYKTENCSNYTAMFHFSLLFSLLLKVENSEIEIHWQEQYFIWPLEFRIQLITSCLQLMQIHHKSYNSHKLKCLLSFWVRILCIAKYILAYSLSSQHSAQ